ncbi:MAG: hypothetical protein HC879_16975 [Leptolyngbyaceae cyanobacterium SL_5_9]|nr:hypothetical protein [Leptolyngbyaceae cyanobacterium SM1_4_3]NJN59062.1 hypothetical protein [Leptolyngbyaceae cyanobacterium SL_5_9]
MIEQHCGIAQDCGLNNLWGGCLTRPDGQDAHPTKCAVYLISIPQKHCGIIEQHYMITANRRKSLQSYSYS